MTVVTALPSAVLLTGATGFLGGHLVEFFSSKGLRIGAIVRNDFNADDATLKNVEFIMFQSGPALTAELEKFKDATVIHCAAYTSRTGTLDDIAVETQSNLAFPVQVFEACRLAGIRDFINIGSFWEHDETGKIARPNSYAAMKLAFQTYLDFMAAKYGLNITTLKLSETYAEGDTRAKVIPLLCNAIENGTRLEMSEGRQQSSFCHISDVVAAFEATAIYLRELQAQGQHQHQVFHVNSGVNTSIRDLAALLAHTAAPARLEIAWGAIPARVGGLKAAWIDGPPPPGWSPKIGLADGLELVWKRKISDRRDT